MLRGAFYGSLAKAFGPLEAIRDGETPLKDLKALGSKWPDLAPRLEPLPEDSALEDADDLIAERLRLFEKGECPPYEASYRTQEDPLKEDMMADVAGFYRAFGLETRGELPDHIVSELEFMAVLCLKEAHATLDGKEDAIRIVRSAQERFLADHLGRWVGRFREAIRRESRVDLYPQLADLLVDFIQTDMRHLGVAAGEATREDGGSGA
jgi:DMSO reductase family type II enzyme chaperone